MVSNAGMNFKSDQFKQFCRQLNIGQGITLSYHHHERNGQVEACIKLVKITIKNSSDNNKGANLALLQIRLKPIGAGLPSPATLLFKRPIRALLPQINREPIDFQHR